MLTMRVDHPDIEDFVTIKNDHSRRKVQYANISCLITHEFMRAVMDDTDFDLRWNGRTFKTVRARELWRKIIENAHASAEPGIIFWDTMREYHNVEYANPLVSTNPCGEQPLAAYTACNLGSINLSKFVDPEGVFDYEDLAEVARTATRFLDDVIDYNMDAHALDKIKEAVASDRRIGLGITGLADALARMGVKYDTDEALEVVDRMMETIAAPRQTSIDLAREKGAYPLFRGGCRSRGSSRPCRRLRTIKQFDAELTVLTVPLSARIDRRAKLQRSRADLLHEPQARVKQEDGVVHRVHVYHPLTRAVGRGSGAPRARGHCPRHRPVFPRAHAGHHPALGRFVDLLDRQPAHRRLCGDRGRYLRDRLPGRPQRDHGVSRGEPRGNPRDRQGARREGRRAGRQPAGRESTATRP
jgi:hypothetical protein